MEKTELFSGRGKIFGESNDFNNFGKNVCGIDRLPIADRLAVGVPAELQTIKRNCDLS